MKLQNFEAKNKKIKEKFTELKKESPEKFEERLNISWSNWGFGLESLEKSAERLNKAGIKYIELHGNHYGADLGYEAKETVKILDKYGIKVSGVCGMFSRYNDLSSNQPIYRQAALDYIKRELEFMTEVGGQYLLIVPGAVGRPEAYDNSEFERSVESLRMLGDLFVKYDIRAAIEPIRSAEVSFIHTVADAKTYINAVRHPGVRHINGDIYHMQSEESHIGEAIIDAGDMLTNLHMADSNRGALGEGAMDLDTIIMSLYLIGYNSKGRFVTPEPLGPGGNPYPAMYGKTDTKILDELVFKTTSYLRMREEEILK